jgi:hypothetical protein
VGKMVQIGGSGQAATFGGGFQLGISFPEIMMIATALTLLLAIIPPMQNPNGVNILDFPGSFVNSFNTLWFNNFNFFKNNGQMDSCVGAINVSALSYTPPADLKNESIYGETNYPVLITQQDFLSQIEGWFSQPSSTGNSLIDAVLFTVRSMFILVIQVTYGFVMLFVQILMNLSNFLVGCSIGGVRLVIGITIAFYWLYHLMGIIGGGSSILKMIFG